MQPGISLEQIVELLDRPLSYPEQRAMAIMHRIVQEAREKVLEQAYDLRTEAATARRRAEILDMDIFALDYQSSLEEWAH